mmetsp:Transcript_3455/g.5728  ORF Transcript_3455/g.5728 Transcript_3455/m.5728 type:complete len:158 (-) Transcript_3455:297-770(-)
MQMNIDGDSTLITTTDPFNGGSSLFNLNCTRVHLMPLQTAADRHRKNPTVSNSTSPNAVKSSPATIKPPTATRVHVTFSSPNKKALSNTHIGLDDLIIVKNVIDILTSDRFDKPTSNAVINPHGIDTPRNVFQDIIFTTVPPKNSGNAADAVKLKIH